MRNKHGGDCYRCGLWVAPGAGYFERHNGGWRVQHCHHDRHGGVTCEMAKVATKPAPPAAEAPASTRRIG